MLQEFHKYCLEPVYCKINVESFYLKICWNVMSKDSLLYLVKKQDLQWLCYDHLIGDTYSSNTLDLTSCVLIVHGCDPFNFVFFTEYLKLIIIIFTSFIYVINLLHQIRPPQNYRYFVHRYLNSYKEQNINSRSEMDDKKNMPIWEYKCKFWRITSLSLLTWDQWVKNSLIIDIKKVRQHLIR
jgi:hypothetical protein